MLLAAASGATDWSAWERAYDPSAKTRFIPVELWTGAPWDGTHAIAMTPASLAFGTRGEKSVSGPMDWTPPGASGPIKVYERLNQGKRQLFTLTNDATGLGRVFDSRSGRNCRGEIKFRSATGRTARCGTTASSVAAARRDRCA